MDIHKWFTTILYLGVIFCIFLLATKEADAAFKQAPYQIVKAAQKKTPPRKGTAARRAWIICKKFRGEYCLAALNIVYCESGFNVKASNGQYLGMFQMGSNERARFGHANNAWVQTNAAYKYFRLSHWTPWECRPYPYY